MRQQPSMSRRALVALALTSVAASSAVVATAPATARPLDPLPSDVRVQPPASVDDQPTAYMVQLDGPPAAVAATTAGRVGASVAQAAQQSRRQRTDNAAAQNRVMRSAADRDLVDRELYRVTTAYNGIAVTADPDDLPRLQSLPGVRTVVPLPVHERSNAASVPAVGAPSAWQAPGGGYAGQGIRVGIIDTGIDYVHRTFGGSGFASDFTDARHALNNPAATPGTPFTVRSGVGDPLFPSQRVAGGFDFAGDAYNAGSSATSTPRPDPNPIDCPLALGGGHGTHVAGTAGGAGVGADGQMASWQTAWPPALTPMVGTGVAPASKLYALRVFGCGGTTRLVPLALDWALDPNGDGSTEDRLDVLNISIGSAFGNQQDPSAVAVQNASAAGVAIAISAGNSGNQTYQVGSPAVAPRAVAVANMVSGSWRDGLQVTGASGGSGANGMHVSTFGIDFNWNALSTPVTAPLFRSPTNRTGCVSFDSSDRAAMVGKVVLLDWLVDDSFSPCGSAERALRVRQAGAAGVVLATTAPTIDLAIAGDSVIPSAYVAAGVRSKLLAAVSDGGASVTFDRQNVARSYDTTSTGTVAELSSRGPAGGGGLKPDLAAPGTDIRSAQSGSGNGSRSLSGTSMAAPHVAGALALLRQRHPTWTVEELKAAVVNTAAPDLHVGPGQTGERQIPSRVGTGTLDIAAAFATDAVAFAADGAGAVGVSFGPLQVPVGAPFHADRPIEVVNRGTSAVTYAVGFDDRNPLPGVSWSFPDGATVEVPADGRRTIRLRLEVDDPSQLRNLRDPTLETVQANYARRWLAEATGLVRLTAAGRPTLSVAAHASVRPAAATAAETPSVPMAPGATAGSISMTGSAFATGTTTEDFEARRTVLEHQATSPRRTVGPGAPALGQADVKHVGVAKDASGAILFGLSMWDRLPAPHGFGNVEITIDRHGDGSSEYLVHTARLTDTDVFVTCTWRIADGAQNCFTPPTSWADAEGGTFDTDVLGLAVPRSAIGLTGSNETFDYTVRTYAPGAAGAVDTVGPLTWSPDAPAVSIPIGMLTSDGPGPLPFVYDRSVAEQTGTLGALILHHLGADGQTAEAVRIGPDQSPQLDVGGPYEVDEGTPLTLDASGSSDPDGEPTTISWDVDGDGTFERQGATTSVTFDDGPGSETVRVRVTAGASDPVEQDVPVTVRNVSPTATLAAIPGDPTKVRLSALDPSAADRVGLALSAETASGAVQGVGTTLDVPVPDVVGPTTITATATDKDDGASAEATIVVTGLRAPPVDPPTDDPPGEDPPVTDPPVADPPPFAPPSIDPLPFVPSPPGGSGVSKSPPAAAKQCRVPRVTGRSLSAARKQLRTAGCQVGKVTRPKQRRVRGKKVKLRPLVVRSQSLKAGTVRKPGTKVALKLREKPRR